MRLIAATLATALFGATSLAAQGADVLLNCTSCHEVAPRTPALDGPAPVPSPYPGLNGQPVRYLERQLYAFREGLRTHPQMQASATALGDGDAAMARLYADAPAPDLVQYRSTDALGDAARLVAQGDWSRGIAPCASCHSRDASMRDRLAPRLHGLPSAYLSAQLRAYADGTRRSDTMGRMRAFSGRLTSAEISQLADYYAAWAPSALVQTPSATPQEGTANYQ